MFKGLSFHSSDAMGLSRPINHTVPTVWKPYGLAEIFDFLLKHFIDYEFCFFSVGRIEIKQIYSIVNS